MAGAGIASAAVTAAEISSLISVVHDSMSMSFNSPFARSQVPKRVTGSRFSHACTSSLSR